MSQHIRLRLAIRRHGVPEAKLIWPCPHSADMTIAKLLASVNEVVPLESSEWGLEDYVVELAGADGETYECLHFQLIAQMLKDEDQVIIRSLLTDDLRRRRLSGRHQISNDGKHLIDGVAFGRPWLQAPRDRPAIELPPRKRARIAAHEMEVVEPQDLLLLEAPPQQDDDDDSDWVHNDGTEADNDARGAERDDISLSDDSGSEEERPVISKKELENEIKDLRDDGIDEYGQSGTNECSVEHLAAIRTAYPLLSFAKIEEELLRQKQDLRKTYETLKQSTTPSLSFDDMMDRMVMGILDQGESSPAQGQAVDIFNRSRTSKKPLIEEVVSEDETGCSSSNSSSSGETSSEAETCLNSNSIEEDDEDSEETDASLHEAASSSSKNITDDSSDDFREASSSDSSDESDLDPVQAPTKVPTQQENTPFHGLTRTQKRNARRRKQKAMSQQKAVNGQIVMSLNSKDAELSARKEALLGVLQKDALDTEGQQPTTNLEKTTNTLEGNWNESSSLPSKEESAKRRARVDMGAGRRLLFGALGLRNPKSKDEEERIRQGLMKDVKLLNNCRIVEVDEGGLKETVDNAADPDAWKEKINYRAVECCHDGMVLSEPPFPFVQRWDPQQQYGSMRKRKRKAEKFEADHDVDIPFNGGKSNSREPSKGETIGAVKLDDCHVRNGVNGHGEADQEDLPEVPKDPSSLPCLEKGAAKKGMVITWKQCTMSKATQWQPVIASFTGEVLSDCHDSSIEARLAFRDRDYTEKLYDEKTGQRIYEKFEVPDLEDGEDGGEDDGHRTLAWQEMMEPKILAMESPWSAEKKTEG